MRLITRAEELAMVARAERAEADASRLRDANAELLNTLLHQRVAPTPATPLPKRAPDRVLEVIADVAGSNHALRKQLGAWARGEKAAGAKEDDVVRGLLHWDEDDSGVPD